MDLLFNDATKEWIWVPLWGAILGAVVGWWFTRILDGLFPSARAVSEPARAYRDPPPRYADVPPTRGPVPPTGGGSDGRASAAMFVLVFATLFYPAKPPLVPDRLFLSSLVGLGVHARGLRLVVETPKWVGRAVRMGDWRLDHRFFYPVYRTSVGTVTTRSALGSGKQLSNLWCPRG